MSIMFGPMPVKAAIEDASDGEGAATKGHAVAAVGIWLHVKEPARIHQQFHRGDVLRSLPASTAGR